MTKDRAKKKAARERAAATGERYVVARRAIEREQAITPSRLHRLTHRMPGMPAHLDGGLQARRGERRRNRPHRPSARTARHHGEPRVLVAWQRGIARLLRAE